MGSFKKYTRHVGGGEGGGWELKSKLKRTGGGVSSLSVHSLCEKNCLIFKEQAEFFLIGCLAVAKCFLF